MEPTSKCNCGSPCAYIGMFGPVDCSNPACCHAAAVQPAPVVQATTDVSPPVVGQVWATHQPIGECVVKPFSASLKSLEGKPLSFVDYEYSFVGTETVYSEIHDEAVSSFDLQLKEVIRIINKPLRADPSDLSKEELLQAIGVVRGPQTPSVGLDGVVRRYKPRSDNEFSGPVLRADVLYFEDVWKAVTDELDEE